MTVFVSGAAGFIGAAVCERLLARGERVVGFDNFNPYYAPALKWARIAQLQATTGTYGTSWALIEADLEDRAAVEAVFSQYKPTRVIHLAARSSRSASISVQAAAQVAVRASSVACSWAIRARFKAGS